ncbi:hypothetical protein C1646_777097 [Rhizophagus diaphanus]|nr:hypothetical protein C1646_777097 [Rhizophagus diaphanus] [Rhizophagus sp. MUCL 43196]
MDYYSKIKRCNDVIKLCKNHFRKIFHKGLSSKSQRYIARFGCYYDHDLDPDKMVEMLIQAEKKNVPDLITAFSDYIRQASNVQISTQFGFSNNNFISAFLNLELTRSSIAGCKKFSSHDLSYWPMWRKKILHMKNITNIKKLPAGWAEKVTILRSSGIRPTMCPFGRSPYEKINMSFWAETIKLWETERLISFLRSNSKLEGLELDDNFFTKLSDENITEEISTRIISDVVKDFNTEELIDYLGRKDLKLDEDDIKILLFKEISDDDKAFKHCMEDIILKLSNVETMTDANEATRCKFISAILHASIAIAKKLTSQDIFIVLQKYISGEDVTGRVDYAIKSLENLLCIIEGKPRNIKIRYAQNLAQLESAFQTNKKKQTADQAFGNDYFDYIYGIVTTGTEWHFIIVYTPDGIYSTSGSEYQINLMKSAVKDNPESLRSNKKRVISIIIGLLKDRVSVDSSPTSKRARIKKLLKNNMYPGLRPELYLDQINCI